MSSVSTFISMFDQFLDDLETTFPNHKKIKTHRIKFNVLKSANPRKVMTTFIEHFKPLSTFIQNKDDTFIIDESVPFLIDLDFKSLWVSEEMTVSTKDAIWAHISTLLFFGSTISGIPDSVMSNIEALASQYAGEMSDDQEGMNPALMMQSMSHMQNMMTKMMKE